jgi:DNA-binding protein HU-beta
MNKIGLIEAVQQQVSVSKREAEHAVEAVFDIITQELVKGQKVNIAGFGMFIAKQRKVREGINPKTGERIHIAATVTPKFRAGNALKSAVKTA